MTDILEHYPDHYADFMMAYEIQMADPNGENPILNGLATFLDLKPLPVITIILVTLSSKHLWIKYSTDLFASASV